MFGGVERLVVVVSLVLLHHYCLRDRALLLLRLLDCSHSTPTSSASLSIQRSFAVFAGSTLQTSHAVVECQCAIPSTQRVAMLYMCADALKGSLMSRSVSPPANRVCHLRGKEKGSHEV